MQTAKIMTVFQSKSSVERAVRYRLNVACKKMSTGFFESCSLQPDSILADHTNTSIKHLCRENLNVNAFSLVSLSGPGLESAN